MWQHIFEIKYSSGNVWKECVERCSEENEDLNHLVVECCVKCRQGPKIFSTLTEES